MFMLRSARLGWGLWGMEDANKMALSDELATIKRYDQGRLYYPAAGRYVTLADLAAFVKARRRFVVVDARTGDDVTASGSPIIVEH
jgi:polyhydroxyalkanoate synthesis regulator protein